MSDLTSRKQQLSRSLTQNEARELFNEIQSKYNVPELKVSHFINNRNKVARELGTSIDDVTIASLLAYLRNSSNFVSFDERPLLNISVTEQLNIAYYQLKLITAVQYVALLVKYGEYTADALLTNYDSLAIDSQVASEAIMQLLFGYDSHYLNNVITSRVTTEAVVKFMKRIQANTIERFKYFIETFSDGAGSSMILEANEKYKLFTNAEIAELIIQKYITASIFDIGNAPNGTEVYEIIYNDTSLTYYLSLIGIDSFSDFVNNAVADSVFRFLTKRQLTNAFIEAIKLFNITTRKDFIKDLYSDIYDIIDIEQVSAVLPPITISDVHELINDFDAHYSASSRSSIGNYVRTILTDRGPSIDYTTSILLCTIDELDNVISSAAVEAATNIPLSLVGSLPKSSKNILISKAKRLDELINDVSTGYNAFEIIGAITAVYDLTGEKVMIKSREFTIDSIESTPYAIPGILEIIVSKPELFEQPKYFFNELIKRIATASNARAFCDVIKLNLLTNEELFNILDDDFAIVAEYPKILHYLDDNVVIGLFKTRMSILSENSANSDELLENLNDNVVSILDDLS